jgi:hypothetical protein
MTARISLLAAITTAILLSCDTDRNVAPVYETYFTKYYGEDGNQIAVDLAVGADGTMVMVGTSQPQTNQVTRGFIVKVDALGTVLWERQMGSDNEVPVDVEFDSRNDILVVSNMAASDVVNSPSIRVTRISPSGSGIDSLTIVHPDAVAIFGTAITEISDGSVSSFIVTGNAGPSLVLDGSMPPPDVEDLLIYNVDAGLTEAKVKSELGGEHVGKIVKLFQSNETGPQRFYTFGDSDRPFGDGGTYIQSFEALEWNEFFISTPTEIAPVGDVQVSNEAIEMPVAMQRGYLMVGSTGQGLMKQIFITQYTEGRTELTRRLYKSILTPRSAEGISVAYGEQDRMFVLADELQDNNNHDIYLAKLASDGTKEGEMRFGSIEGDDQAAAVRILPDQRIAVFGTIELQTQKKMMLTLVSPTGTFSE